MNGMCFFIQPGQKVAFVGELGCGKKSIVKYILEVS